MEVSVSRFRKCSKCGVTKPATTQFFFKSDIKQGLKQCKTCRSVMAKSNYQRDRDKAKAIRRDYYRQNREELLAKQKEHCDENREKVRAGVRRSEAKRKDKKAAYQKQYREENKEKIAAYDKEYRRKNKDKIDAYFKKHYLENKDYYQEKYRKREAMKRGNGYEPYTANDILGMWYEQNGLCYYCETPMFSTYNIEHMIPIVRGGRDALDNICLACFPCNRAKHTKTAEEYFAYLNKL